MPKSMENKVYAGFFVRLIAFAIDSLLAAIAVSIVKLPLSIASGSLKVLRANILFDFSVIDVISYLGVAAYFVLLTYFAHATIGKMLLRIEVVAEEGEWNFLNILYRETVGRFLSSFIYIGYLAVLVTKNKQGFHDMLCDTYVVYKKMQKELRPRVCPEPRQEPIRPIPEPITVKPIVEPATPVINTVHPAEPEKPQAPTYH